MDETKAKDVAKDVGIQVAAVGVGLAIGGPVGAFAGAAVAPIAQAFLARRQANGNLFAEVLTDLTGLSPVEVASWAADSEGRSYLLTSAFDAAVASRMEAKVRALAEVVIEGLHDDARIDYATIMVGALAELDKPHVQVLHALIRSMDQRPPSRSGEEVGERGWLTSQLEAHLPHLVPAIGAVGSVLVRNGLVTDSGLWGKSDDSPWSPTPFGVHCLEYLEGGNSRPKGEGNNRTVNPL